jgi:energy-coupling factor transport system permease protein
MLKPGFLHRSLQPGLVESSPLRQVDPRVKLCMALCASLMVMLPLDRLVIFILFYVSFLAWGRLLPAAARQAWRLRWLLMTLFVLDAWLVSWELAIAVTMRLLLLAGVFSLLVSTTTPRELSLALEGLRLPYRYAFSLSLAFQSLGLLEDEWRAIYEAQISRGVSPFRRRPLREWRELLRQMRTLIAFTVPAIVLTTKRAWSISEAAHARGFDSPHRRPYRRLVMSSTDWLYLAAALLTSLGFFIV